MHEERLTNMVTMITTVVKKNKMIGEKVEPAVYLTLQSPVSGSIRVHSLLNQEAEEFMKNNMKDGMDKDVITFTCIGGFESGSGSIGLSCNIINDNGMPVRMKKKYNDEVIRREVSNTMKSIIDVIRTEGFG